MQIHPQARTTPAVRAEIARSTDPTSVLAKRYGISDETVRKWRKRGALACQDRSSRPKRLPWRVTEEERAIICTVRRTTGFPLDDLTFTLRHFLPHLNRDNIYRVLRAEGLNRRPPKQSSQPAKGQGRFRDYDLGYVHIDVKHLPKLRTADGEVRKRYLYVAIDRCSRFAHLAVFDAETAANAVAFLAAAQKAFPFRITHVLTDRGSCFTADDFENACEKIKVIRRTTKPYTPQTNGMVERFNGRIASEVLGINVAGHADLEILLLGFNHAYNRRRQRVLSGGSPIDTVRRHLARNGSLANPNYKPADSNDLLPKVDEILYYANEVSQPDNYPVYMCAADYSTDGRPRCQEVRALRVDAEVERLLLAALRPDQIALAIAALGEIEQESQVLERQWTLKRERARFEADRARRQYDTVEPENRLVARSLERLWEDKLRRAEEVEREHDAWSRAQAISLTEGDRADILALGENIPLVWHAGTTTSADRKQIVRLVISDVFVDQKRERGRVWIKIIWQTGATSEHWLQRRVQSYAHHADPDRLQSRIRELNASNKMDAEIAIILNAEGLCSAHGPAFKGETIHLLRKRWHIPTVKINGSTVNPKRWPDGTYSVQGAAEVLGITSQTIFDWLRKGWLSGHQLAKGMPWQIILSEEQAMELRTRVRHTSESRREAS